jgi:hypothetical protein
MPAHPEHVLRYVRRLALPGTEPGSDAALLARLTREARACLDRLGRGVRPIAP